MRVCLPLPGPNEHNGEGVSGRLGIAERFGVEEGWREMRKSFECIHWKREQASTTGQALTHATRHVRQETRVLPLDPAYRLVVFRIRYRGPFCFPLHGFQD